MSTLAVVILFLGTLGHLALWVELVNRVHAFGIRRIWVDLLTLACGAMLACIPPAVAAVLSGLFQLRSPEVLEFIEKVIWCYLAVCSAFFLIDFTRRLIWRLRSKGGGALLSNHTSSVTLPTSEGPLLAPGVPSWLGNLPGNQVLQLCLQEKEIAIPRLTAAGDPIRIAHISDLHMCGRIARAYFEQVVEEVNALNPDLVAITGDIVEYEKCLAWIPSTLARLRAPSGVFYVLGNHDRHHIDQFRLTTTLAEAGLQYLGGTYRTLTVRGIPLLLAGNEMPWLWPAANLHNCAPHDEAGLPLRIVLAHSPDQFRWAQANDVDLMLAGHLHGGQVCLPWIGAIVAPSNFGVKYASGVFTAGNTVMHVTRGTGSLSPLRYNCPPEISLLKLYPGTQRN